MPITWYVGLTPVTQGQSSALWPEGLRNISLIHVVHIRAAKFSFSDKS
jgi:hypothetical protein